MVRSVVQSIAQVPDELKRSIYVQESASRLGMPVDDLLGELGRQAIQKLEKEAKAPLPSLKPAVDAPIGATRLSGKVGREGREKDLLRLLLQYGRHKVTLALPEGVEAPEPTEDGEPATIEVALAEFMMHELDSLGLSIRNPVVDRVVQHVREEMVGGRIPLAEDLGLNDPEVMSLTADLLVTEFTLSSNWLERHGIQPETEEDQLKVALQGALHRLMLDEARGEGYRIRKRLEEMAEDPSTSEDPAAEEVDLLRKKMAVSKRVSLLALHFESTILHDMRDEDVRKPQ